MITRTVLFFLSVSFCAILLSFVKDDSHQDPPKQKVIKTIIIDPGHGGSDAGAHGEYSLEKNICLAISLKLGKMIEKEFPDLQLFFTRTDDSYPALHTRADFANEKKGDLFLCIHVNSAPPVRHSELIGHKNVTYYTGKGKKRKKKTKVVPEYRYWTTPNPAKGTETYIWGAHRNEQKELAMRENSQMFQEENFEKNYGAGFDPGSPEFIAMSLLKTKQYFKRSAMLAGLIQDEFVKVGRVDRDVKQRPVGIWVLQATAMPSVLVETGFISNPDEERFLNSEEGQAETAACIIKALKTYIDWLEKQQNKEGDSNGSNNGAVAKKVSAFLQQVEEKEMHPVP